MTSSRFGTMVLLSGCILALAACQNGRFLGSPTPCTFSSAPGTCSCPEFNPCDPLWWCQDSPCCQNSSLNGCRYGIDSDPEPGHPATPKLCTGDIKALNSYCGYVPETGESNPPGGGVGQPDVRLAPLQAVPALPFGCQDTTVWYRIGNISTDADAPASSGANPARMVMQRMVNPTTPLQIGKIVTLDYPALGKSGSSNSYVEKGITYSRNGDSPAPLDPNAEMCRCNGTFRALFDGIPLAPGSESMNPLYIEVMRNTSGLETPEHGVFGHCVPGPHCTDDESSPIFCRTGPET